MTASLTYLALSSRLSWPPSKPWASTCLPPGTRIPGVHHHAPLSTWCWGSTWVLLVYNKNLSSCKLFLMVPKEVQDYAIFQAWCLHQEEISPAIALSSQLLYRDSSYPGRHSPPLTHPSPRDKPGPSQLPDTVSKKGGGPSSDT